MELERPKRGRTYFYKWASRENRPAIDQRRTRGNARSRSAVSAQWVKSARSLPHRFRPAELRECAARARRPFWHSKQPESVWWRSGRITRSRNPGLDLRAGEEIARWDRQRSKMATSACCVRKDQTSAGRDRENSFGDRKSTRLN